MSINEFVRILSSDQHRRVTGLRLNFNQFHVLLIKCIRIKLKLGFLFASLFPLVIAMLIGSFISLVQNSSSNLSDLKSSKHLLPSENIDYSKENLQIDEQETEEFRSAYTKIHDKVYISSEPKTDQETLANFVKWMDKTYTYCDTSSRNFKHKTIPLDQLSKQIGNHSDSLIIVFGKEFSHTKLNYTIYFNSLADFGKHHNFDILIPAPYSKYANEKPSVIKSEPFYANSKPIILQRFILEAFATFPQDSQSADANQTDCSDLFVHSLPRFQNKSENDFIVMINSAKNKESVYGGLFQFLLFVSGMQIIGTICAEKKTKSKEFLRLMGASRFIIYSTHFVFNFVIIFVQCIILVVYMFQDNFSRLIWQVVAISFVLPITLHILFCFLITIFFHNPLFANACYMVFLFMISSGQKFIQEPSDTAFMLYNLLPLTLMNNLWTLGYNFDFEESYSFTSEWNTKVFDFKNLSFANLTYVGLFSCLLCSFLIYYFDNVWPFQYGVPKPFYFVFSPDYWFGKKEEETIDGLDLPLKQQNDKFEPDQNLPVIRIRNLCKGFFTKWKAFGYRKVIDKLNLSICSNQLTVLLGHNGAGKTTLMDMITGISTFDSGSIFVNNISLRKNLTKARGSIGLCPQDNIFYHELTVYYNFRLAAVLRGMPTRNLKQKIFLVAQKLGLEAKLFTKAGKLSGGMKRRLCLGCAFIGFSDVLIFDEPTSGLDPETRRDLWNVFIELRKTKTILLTTHFMEEADILGDRIAILDQGQLVCYGSPSFLKKVYNTGYLLKVEILPEGRADEILNVVQQHVPLASLENQKQLEINFRLPTADESGSYSLNSKLSFLFETLENQKQKLHISSIGLMNTSLEDVFIRAGEISSRPAFKDGQKENEELGSLVGILSNVVEDNFNRKMIQLLSVMKKRMNYIIRMPVSFLFQLILPFLCFFFYLYLVNKISLADNISSFDVRLSDKQTHYSVRNAFVLLNPDDSNPTHDIQAQQMKDYAKSVFDIDLSLFSASNHTLFLAEKIVSKLKNDSYAYMFGYTFSNKQNVQFYTNWKFSYAVPIMNDIYFHRNGTSVDFGFSSIQVPIRHILVLQNSFFARLSITVIMFLGPFLFIVQQFLVVPSTEISRSSILIQRIGGLSPHLYWYFNFIFDYLVYVIIVSLLVGKLIFIDYWFYEGRDYLNFGLNHHFLMNSAMLLLCGVSLVCMTYLLAGMRFGLESSNLLFFVLFLAGAMVPTAYFHISDALKLFDYKWMNILRVPLYVLLPSFNMLYYFTKQVKHASYRFCDSLFPQCTAEKFQGIELHIESWNDLDSLEIHLMTAFASAILFLVLLYFIESVVDYVLMVFENIERIFRRLFSCFGEKSLPTMPKGDVESVQLETLPTNDLRVKEENALVHQLVSEKKFESKLLIVNQLNKWFGNLHAVKNVSFTVNYNECFGLLGLNGAGKTSIFSMLTGDTSISSGEVYLTGLPVHNDKSLAYPKIAYCPQIECNFDNLTVFDSLTYYSSIIGLPHQYAKQLASKMISMCDLEEYRNISTNVLSGGNKRKLSLSVALLGIRDLTLLDEPTTGVDPVAKRKIWNTMEFFKSSAKKSFIFTSHSMEECERLCNRIAIMAAAEIRCIGTYSQLRDTYAQGYKLLIRLDFSKISESEYTESIVKDVTSTFQKCQLKEFHLNSMVFYIGEAKIEWAFLFKQLEVLNKKWHFIDYIISETTLEQVFLSFSKTTHVD